MKTAQTVLTACLLGAGLGAASYLMHSKPVAPVPVVDDARFAAIEMADVSYWKATAAKSAVAQYQRDVCRTLHNSAYADSAGNCSAPVDCTSCITHKGKARYAVIHDNAWVRAPKTGGPDYGLLMAQEKLVFQMSMANQGATEAGRRAYDHSIRCSRLTWAADAQCK